MDTINYKGKWVTHTKSGKQGIVLEQEERHRSPKDFTSPLVVKVRVQWRLFRYRPAHLSVTWATASDVRVIPEPAISRQSKSSTL